MKKLSWMSPSITGIVFVDDRDVQRHKRAIRLTSSPAHITIADCPDPGGPRRRRARGGQDLFRNEGE